LICSAGLPKDCVKRPHQSRLQLLCLLALHHQPGVKVAGKLHKCHGGLSKSKFVTGGSARRSMSGSDGMRTTYNYWLTPHVAELQATAKLILLGPPSDCWCYKCTVQGKLGQCSAKPSSFVCHVGSGNLAALHCTAASYWPGSPGLLPLTCFCSLF